MEIAENASLPHRVWNWRKIYWLIGALITAAAVYLHWVNFRSAGTLWRDEAGIVRIATLRTLHEMWSNIGHESCPILFPALIRVWSFTVGESDTALRVFGFVVGLLILAAVWLNGWSFHHSAPVVALGLLAVNASVIRSGDSLRAYGLASVLMLVTLAMVWRFARAPDRKSWVVAGLAAVISVQCLFQNSFLLLATCTAAAAVTLRRKDYKNALAALAIGIPAAISLLPYREIIREAQDWSVLSQIGFQPALIWTSLSAAMAPRHILVALAVGWARDRCDRALCEGDSRSAGNPRGCCQHCRLLWRNGFDRWIDRFFNFLADCENADAGLVLSATRDFCRSLHRRHARALAVLALRVCDSHARLHARRA